MCLFVKLSVEILDLSNSAGQFIAFRMHPVAVQSLNGSPSAWWSFSEP